MGDIVGDLLVEKYASATCCEDDKTDNECAKIKRHIYIIA